MHYTEPMKTYRPPIQGRGQVARLLFRICGWQHDERPLYIDRKQIMVGFPHTSNMDGVLAIALLRIYGLRARILMKEEMFRFPFRRFFRWLGFVPVSRGKRSNLVEELTKEFAENDEFTLVIAPEATRNKANLARKPIKTGFWQIAQAAGVPIILVLASHEDRRMLSIGRILPSGDIRHDLLNLQRTYERYGVYVPLPPELTGDGNSGLPGLGLQPPDSIDIVSD